MAGDLLAKDRTVDWSVLVDAGWVGLEVPEQFGGAGATFAEVAVICEEMGRAASANSYLGSAVLAVGTLKALQPSDTRDRLLADVASGAVRVAVALESTDFVPDAEGADRVLVIGDGGVSVAPRPSPLNQSSTRPAGWPPWRISRCPRCCGSTETPNCGSSAAGPGGGRHRLRQSRAQ